MVLDAFLLNTQLYKIHTNDEVQQYRKMSYTLV